MCGCNGRPLATTTAGHQAATGAAVERLTRQAPRAAGPAGYGVGALLLALVVGVLLAKAVRG